MTRCTSLSISPLVQSRSPLRPSLLAGLVLISPKDDEVDDVLAGEFSKLDALLTIGSIQLIHTALLQICGEERIKNDM